MAHRPDGRSSWPSRPTSRSTSAGCWRCACSTTWWRSTPATPRPGTRPAGPPRPGGRRPPPTASSACCPTTRPPPSGPGGTSSRRPSTPEARLAHAVDQPVGAGGEPRLGRGPVAGARAAPRRSPGPATSSWALGWRASHPWPGPFSTTPRRTAGSPTPERAGSPSVALVTRVVTIVVGEIPLVSRRNLNGSPGSRSRPLQARLVRRRGLRLQAQAGPERRHHQRDVVDEGRARLDAPVPAQVLPALRAAPDAQLGRRHVGDLLRRHLLLHQADRQAGRRLGRAPRVGQEHLREARHPRGRAQVPRRRHRAVRVRGRLPPQP